MRWVRRAAHEHTGRSYRRPTGWRSCGAIYEALEPWRRERKERELQKRVDEIMAKPGALQDGADAVKARTAIEAMLRKIDGK